MMRENKFIEHFCAINRNSILEQGQPWSRFILQPDDHPLRDRTKQALLSHPNILKITEKLTQHVIDPESPKPNPSNFRVYGSFYWLLRFLADIGITAEDFGITSFIEQAKLSQLEDGQFMIRYHQNKQQAIAFVCITAHLTYCLSRLGLKTSRTVTAAANYLATTQRFDGGWHCDQLKQNGERDQFLPSCQSATIHSILALSQFGKTYQKLLETAVSLFLASYETKSIPSCIYNSENQVNVNKLRYPPHYTGLDILNVIYTLSFVPDQPEKSKIGNLINHVLSQCDGSHWLGSAKKIPEWKNFDFGFKNKGSDWISSLFLTSLERYFFKMKLFPRSDVLSLV
ncbi:MAG: hypothetical protein MUC94_06265 [bacterium]|nr:hypothetical protein [bacterium]